MRIVLLVILLYSLLFSVGSLVMAIASKQIKKYKLFGKKDGENAVTVIKKSDDPSKYWLLSLMHLVNIFALAFIIIKFVIA